MERITWTKKFTNEDVLGKVNEDEQMSNDTWQRKHYYMMSLKEEQSVSQ